MYYDISEQMYLQTSECAVNVGELYVCLYINRDVSRL